jgi:hypothetical protein
MALLRVSRLCGLGPMVGKRIGAAQQTRPGHRIAEAPGNGFIPPL